MKRRSIGRNKKRDENSGVSEYALKIERQENKYNQILKTQNIPIERIPVLTIENKRLLITEMEYGLSERTLREYTDAELRYIVGYCLTNNLINNFKFLPLNAGRYLAPALKIGKNKEAAIEALKVMNYEVARFVCGALLNPNQREGTIEALQGMNYKAGRFVAPALSKKKKKSSN